MGFAAENTPGGTLEGRLAYFQSFTVAHPHLVAAKDALIAGIRQSEPNAIVMVFGPTGVGKTTLRMNTEQISHRRTPSATGKRSGAHPGGECRSHRARLRQFLLAQPL